jgi:exopolysaccharide biosynthesis polyprenyl glycosylphosphotransferase
MSREAGPAPLAAPEPTSASPSAAAATQLERAAAKPPTWPVTRLPALAAGVLLVASAWLPLAVASPGAVQTLVLLPASGLGALVVRLVFEAAVGAASASKFRIALACSAASALGFSLTLGLAAALSVDLSPAAALIGMGATAATLSAATAARTLEIRLGTSTRRVFFVGAAEQSADLAHEIGKRGDMTLVGSLSPSESEALVDAGRFTARVLDSRPTTLVISSEAVRHEGLVAAASALNLQGIRIRTLNDFYEEQFAKVPLSELSRAWFLFDIAEIHSARPYGFVKRCFETAIAVGLLVLLAPLLPVVTLAVKLSSPGPVFFRQRRVGRGGHIFTLTKFRTMRVEDATAPHLWGTDHGDRVTPVGRVLRRFRLDELPQLWHVLTGDLSLVGPRPERPEIVAHLTRKMEFYPARLCIRPGLTGWAQINYGYGGSDAGTVQKLQYDFYYIKRQRLRLDLLIIASTVRILLSGRGY